MNPYLDEFRTIFNGERRADLLDMDIDAEIAAFGRREVLVRRFAWAVPNQDAIDALVKLSPIVEIGAGTGYWANLLRQSGAEIEAFDNRLFWRNNYSLAAYFPIAKGGPERALRMYGDRTLLLSWPPYSGDMAERALKLHRGEHVAYIGEGPGGCTGNDNFRDLLDERYERVEEVSIPSWPGLRDWLEIYRRRG